MRIHKKIAVSNTITFIIFLIIIFFFTKEYIDLSNIKNTYILKIGISIFIFFLYFTNESHIFMQNSNRKESIGILSFCAEVSVFSYKNCIFATKLINKLTP